MGQHAASPDHLILHVFERLLPQVHEQALSEAGGDPRRIKVFSSTRYEITAPVEDPGGEGLLRRLREDRRVGQR